MVQGAGTIFCFSVVLGITLMLLHAQVSVLTQGAAQDSEPCAVCNCRDGRTGYNTALKRLGDPALAINHLLQTMYTNLQVCALYP